MENRSSPFPSPDASTSLRDHIADLIQTHPDRRIPFTAFMDAVLYHPQYGYYSTQEAIGSRRGDFVTSPNLCADFGELLAEQFREMWERLDHPNPYRLIEMGAGQGRLADDILQYLQRQAPDCFEAVQYGIVERSPQLIAQQRERLNALTHKIQWYTWDTIPSNSVIGCFFSNELVDAFPVHQVIRQDGQLQEIYLTVDESGTWREVSDRPSTDALQAYFDRIEIDLTSDAYPDGYRTEVNLAALDWLKTVGDRLHRGYILTIDYGYPAQRYYSPARSQGTLQCYYQHQHHSDPYLHLGQQDITAHVDFTALERQGEQGGLRTVGFTQQGLFLMALGLGDRLLELSTPKSGLDLQTILLRREALHGLADPTGVGNFGVLVQSKGMEGDGAELKGFRMPPMG
ncbi:MAG: class I SAM-dependent methyltransferase [Synechococcales cyanobacterium T60_A2020_003]|nr:class I SAM-dependent methyltransferase [Synechococcales cyanobacterium T60_A2020_003]